MAKHERYIAFATVFTIKPFTNNYILEFDYKSIMAIDENTALCRILIRAFKKTDKEQTCLEIVKSFIDHKDFDKTIDELAKVLGTEKDKVMEVISTSCIPCLQEEEK